jgi:hypothetical protein
MPFTYAYYTIGAHLDELGYGYEVRLFDNKDEQQNYHVFRTRDEADEYIQDLRDMGQLDDC